MRYVLVTGSSGFIGKNLCSQLELTENIQILQYTKENNFEELTELVEKADFIFHIAGVNRPDNEQSFETDNTGLTEQIIQVLRTFNKKTPLLITSSTQAELDNPYGKSKLAAENVVFSWHKESGAPVYVYRLPGVFGKWSKPNYNSVVATFCNNIANNLPIEISKPEHVVTLAYIDDVIKEFCNLLADPNSNFTKHKHISRTFDVTLGDLSDRIHMIHNIRTSLIVPNLNDLLNKFLYATYTSYLKEDNFSYELSKNSDQRGWLAEFVKSYQFGQIFISKTKPGISRGDHWHKTKIEKFLVVEGLAEITFRNKIGDQGIIKYTVSGDDTTVLDIPVGYVHSIKNIGDNDLITIFWANEILDKEAPDTFYEKVTTGDEDA